MEAAKRGWLSQVLKRSEVDELNRRRGVIQWTGKPQGRHCGQSAVHWRLQGAVREEGGSGQAERRRATDGPCGP